MKGDRMTLAVDNDTGEETGLLEWLMRQADQKVAEAFNAAAIPVA
jgi:hypothetical protein